MVTDRPMARNGPISAGARLNPSFFSARINVSERNGLSCKPKFGCREFDKIYVSLGGGQATPTNVRYCKKQTFQSHRSMSASDPKRTFSPRNKSQGR